MAVTQLTNCGRQSQCKNIPSGQRRPYPESGERVHSSAGLSRVPRHLPRQQAGLLARGINPPYTERPFIFIAFQRHIYYSAYRGVNGFACRRWPGRRPSRGYSREMAAIRPD